MSKRIAAALLAIAAAAFIPLGFLLSGCASIPWEKRALAIEKAACLAQSEALSKSLTQPGYAKALQAEAQRAYQRVMEALVSGREADARDLATLDEAKAVLGGVMECL